MRNNNNGLIRKATMLALCAAIAACGGGGGSDGSSAAAASAATSGTASKGVLEKALVTAYAISGGAKSNKLAEARTDVNGKYSLSLGSHSGPVLLELTVDSTTLMTCDVPAGCNNGTAHAFGSKLTPQSTLVLQSVLSSASGTVSSAITPFTYLAAQLALKNGGSAADIDAALTQIAALFDLPSLNATQPVDITAANLGSNLDAQRYAVMNAAIAKLGGSDLVAGLNSLVNEIKANGNGQLYKDDNDAAKPSLADVLEAASDVAQSSAVNTKLNSLIAVAIAADLAEVEGQTTLTEANPAPLPGASDLVKAKAFVTSTHDILQSLRGYGSADDVLSELQGRYSSLQVFSGDDHEASSISVAADAVLGFAAEKAAVAARNGLTASFDAEDVQEYFDDLNYGSSYRLKAVDGLVVTVNTGNKTVSFNGTVKVQRVTDSWCDFYPWEGCPSSTPVGAASSFEVSNIAVQYPDINTAQNSFSAGVVSQGYIRGAKTKLQLQGTGPNQVTVTYATAAKLISHLDAYDSSATAANDLPEKVEASLKNVVFAVGSNLALPDVTFTGSLSVRANKANLKLTDPTNSSARRTTLIPTLASFNGSFVGLQGDKLDAVLSVELASPYDNQGMTSPAKGYIRPGLFSYRYDAGTATESPTAYLKLKLTSSDRLYWGWGWYDDNHEIMLKLGSVSTGAGYSAGYTVYNSCDAGLRPILYSGAWNSTYWNTLSCTTSDNLPAALSALNWGRGDTTGPNSGWLQYMFAADILYGGLYLPKSPAGFTYNSATEVLLAGEVIEYYDEYAEDSNTFAKGNVSAKLTLHTTLNGKPLDVVTDLTAQRLSYQGGDAKLVLTINGQSITLNSPVNAGVPLFQLSDKNGASVVLLPGTNGADSAITINGQTMGHIKRLGSAYVVRFVDNSLIAL